MRKLWIVAVLLLGIGCGGSTDGEPYSTTPSSTRSKRQLLVVFHDTPIGDHTVRATLQTHLISGKVNSNSDGTIKARPTG